MVLQVTMKKNDYSDGLISKLGGKTWPEPEAVAVWELTNRAGTPNLPASMMIAL